MSFINNQKNQETKGESMSLIVSPGTSGLYMYVLKKLEKIVSATFLVTDLFPEKDILGEQLRSVSLDLVAKASRDQSLESIQGALIEFISLLNIAHQSGRCSDMNYSILKSEIDNLVQKIQKDIEGTFTLSKTFFDAPEVATESVREGHSAHVNVKQAQSNTAPDSQTHNKRQTSRSDRVSIKKHERQEKILKLIKDMKQAQVSDLSQKISGVSDKTIQRELGVLVEQGKVRREGQRRWSTYSLA